MTTIPTNNYNPHEHLVQIKDKQGGSKDYYPAAWRLYELRLKHPTITIESEIIHMNEEKNFVVIKASIFDGKTYEESSMRATSMKQGLLSALDKVETAAKARASRDFGISTELALDSEPEEDLDATSSAKQNKSRQGVTAAPRALPQGKSDPLQAALEKHRDRAHFLGVISSDEQWWPWLKAQGIAEVKNGTDLKKVNDALVAVESQKKAS